MTEKEREEKKRKKKEETFWEYFIYSMLQKCAAAAVEAVFNELFGERQDLGSYSELEQSIITQLEGIAAEEIEDLFSDWTGE